MSAQTDGCGKCGTPVTREVPDGEDRISIMIRKVVPWCDDCTAAAEARREEEERSERTRVAHEEMLKRVKRSGLPEKYHGLRIGELEQPPEVLSAAEHWALDGGGLLLTGEIGRGKTMLAGAAAWQRLRSRHVLWTSAPLLFARLGTGLGSDQRDWALEVLADTRALVLDDVDKARPTEYGAEQVFLAVDQRVEHRSPLLVTSNLAPSQLADRWPEPYGEAIASRLVGYCDVVRIEGADRRLHPVSGPPQALGMEAPALPTSTQEEK